MVTITFCNQKGGVSKTTSAAETASILASRGNRVLVVDMDPQGNLSDIFGVTTDGRDTMYELLKGEASFDDVCVLRGGVAVLPSEITLAMLEPELAGASLGREQRLAKILRKYSNEYDFTVIDCPPSLSLLPTMSLVASDFVVIPVTASLFAAKGISQLWNTVSMVREYANPSLGIAGILFTKHHANYLNSADIAEVASMMALQMGTKVFDTRIREAVEVEYAHTAARTVFDYNPLAKPSVDYLAFVDELLATLEVM